MAEAPPIFTVGGYQVQLIDGILNVSTLKECIFRVNLLACCGVKELHNIRYGLEQIGADGLIHQLAEMMYGKTRTHNCAFYLFTEVQPTSWNSGKYGVNLRDFILTNKLGTVIESDILKNPNSLNMLKVYLWQIDSDALKTFHGVKAAPMIAMPIPELPMLDGECPTISSAQCTPPRAT